MGTRVIEYGWMGSRSVWHFLFLRGGGISGRGGWGRGSDVLYRYDTIRDLSLGNRSRCRST